MSYLIDTVRVAEFLKGRATAVTLLASLSHNRLAISLITYGEIYEGIYFGTNPKKHEQSLLAFLRGVEVLSLNKRVMKEFAQIRGSLRSSGQLIGHMDILIAATAITYDLTLITGNKSHFARIPGLVIY